MPSEQIVVVGSANLDLVFRCGQLPKPGETLLGEGFSMHPGGKGANQAVAISRLGGSVVFVGKIGNDAFGAVLSESLLAAGVSTAGLEVSEVSSGTACILVDSSGMNSIVVAPGANEDVTASQVSAFLRSSHAKFALGQLEIPLATVEAAADVQFFILNPAPACDLPDSLLGRCQVITPNESETFFLTGIDPATDQDCLAAGQALLDRGVQNVVITRGERGSYWVSRSGGRHFEAPTVRHVDTTAAGDAFNGALALFLSEGREMANAIALANCVGALSTTKRGAQESMPSLMELRAIAGSLY